MVDFLLKVRVFLVVSLDSVVISSKSLEFGVEVFVSCVGSFVFDKKLDESLMLLRRNIRQELLRGWKRRAAQIVNTRYHS